MSPGGATIVIFTVSRVFGEKKGGRGQGPGIRIGTEAAEGAGAVQFSRGWAERVSEQVAGWLSASRVEGESAVVGHETSGQMVRVASSE